MDISDIFGYRLQLPNHETAGEPDRREMQTELPELQRRRKTVIIQNTVL